MNVYASMGSDVEYAVPRDLVAQSIVPQINNVPPVITIVPPLNDQPRVINPTTDIVGSTVTTQSVPIQYLFSPIQRLETATTLT